MSRSRLMLIVGPAGRYDGEGIMPDGIFTFYDDKGVWRFDSLYNGESVRLFSRSLKNIFDELFLMLSLFILKNEIEKTKHDSLIELVKNISKNFDANSSKNNQVLEIDENKSDEEIEKVYTKNKEILKNFQSLKLVLISLGKVANHIGGFEIDGINVSEFFLKKAKEYGLQNFEICKSESGNFKGDWN